MCPNLRSTRKPHRGVGEAGFVLRSMDAYWDELPEPLEL